MCSRAISYQCLTMPMPICVISSAIICSCQIWTNWRHMLENSSFSIKRGYFFFDRIKAKHSLRMTAPETRIIT